MKVKCKYRCFEDIENSPVLEACRDDRSEGYVDDELKVGKIYTVYGLLFINSVPMYIIDADISKEYPYPIPYPYIFFDVVDARLSKYWQLNVRSESDSIFTEFIFPDWIKNRYFYSDLIDQNENSLKVYKKYKELMDKEFE